MTTTTTTTTTTATTATIRIVMVGLTVVVLVFRRHVVFHSGPLSCFIDHARNWFKALW
jgi:hypothetical protein